VAVSAHGISGLLDTNLHISDIIAVSVQCNKWLRPLLLPWRHWLVAHRELKQRDYYVAIIPRSPVDDCYATFLAYFSGAPCRVGYTQKMDSKNQHIKPGLGSAPHDRPSTVADDYECGTSCLNKGVTKCTTLLV